MFRTDQHEYQAYAESAGTRVVIHNPDEYEFLTSFGLYASVGLTTNMAIKMVCAALVGNNVLSTIQTVAGNAS